MSDLDGYRGITGGRALKGGTLATGYLPGRGRFGAARPAPETRSVPLDRAAAICPPPIIQTGQTDIGARPVHPRGVFKNGQNNNPNALAHQANQPQNQNNNLGPALLPGIPK